MVTGAFASPFTWSSAVTAGTDPVGAGAVAVSAADGDGAFTAIGFASSDRKPAVEHFCVSMQDPSKTNPTKPMERTAVANPIQNAVFEGMLSKRFFESPILIKMK